MDNANNATNRIPCGACNGSEYTGAGYTDSDHCDACQNGQAVCYCGEPATAVECGDPVCAAHFGDEGGADAEPVPAPADAGRTKRIPVQSMSQLVYGGAA